MQKYVSLFHISWSEGFTYRASFLLWRFRQFLVGFMALSLWQVALKDTSAFGYDQNQMFSYIFITTLLQNIIWSSALNNLSGFIYSGDLSNILVKPINIFSYFIAQDVADKLKNVFFTCFEMIVLWFIFQPTLPAPDLTILPLFFLTFFGGILIMFFLQLLFGAIGFWSPETWGPRFIFYTLLTMTVGQLYPLDILPSFAQHFLYLTPLPYITYIQTQLLLGRIEAGFLIERLSMLLLWVSILGASVLITWRKGIKTYQAMGH